MLKKLAEILTKTEPSAPEIDWESRALAVALEEYKALRSEIQDRVKNEFVLITASATLTSAGVALWAQSSARSLTMLLAIPLLSFLLAFLHFAQENSIAAAAAYLNKNVRQRLVALLPPRTTDGQAIMSWEDFRDQAIYRAPWPIRALTAIGVFTPAVPGIVITNWILILLFVVASVHNWKMYQLIT